MWEMSVAELQAAQADGRVTAGQLLQSCLERVAQLDRQGPSLGAVLQLDPAAEATAAGLDAERRQGHVRGPLHGIPVLVKDNVDTAGGTNTTAGSLALQSHAATRDAHLVLRLRQAGAVLLGKANLSEWANFRSTRSSSGWSSCGGQTHNPYVLDRTPCGSSSGSAVGVAAGLCPLAVGTETDGSIVCPAAANGLVGIKPTVGLVSRSGLVPISHSQDTAGPLARSVADAAVLLQALVGTDPTDPATAPLAGLAAVDYRTALAAPHLQGVRLGLVRSLCPDHEGVARLVAEAVGALTELGAVVIDLPEMPGQAELGKNEFDVLLYEFKDGIDRYLSGLGPDLPVHSLAELIDYNQVHADRTMPFFQQEILEMSQEKGPLTERAYQRAWQQTRELSRREGTDAALDGQHLDALMALTAGPPGVIDLVLGDHGLGGSSTPAAAAGYPAITVPAGLVHGLPVGISFWSGAFREDLLLRVASAFERATQARRPPAFAPTVSAAL